MDLAGVALGTNLFWPTILFVMGVILSLTPSVSQLHGAGRERESGEVVRQAGWIALVGGGALILVLRNAGPIYRVIEVDPLAIPIAVAYLDALSWGVLPMLGYSAFRYLCDGNSWTLPAMVVAVSGLLLKVAAQFAVHIRWPGPAGHGWRGLRLFERYCDDLPVLGDGRHRGFLPYARLRRILTLQST